MGFLAIFHHFFTFCSCGPKFVLIQANYLLYRVWSWNSIFFGWRHHFCLWRHNIGIYRKKMSHDVTWRKHVGFWQNFQEMFLLLIWTYAEYIKSFICTIFRGAIKFFVFSALVWEYIGKSHLPPQKLCISTSTHPRHSKIAEKM